MGRKRHSPEEIIGKLREAEILIAGGQTTPQAAKAIGVTEHASKVDDAARKAAGTLAQRLGLEGHHGWLS